MDTIVTCIMCRTRNRVSDRLAQSVCGACRSPLILFAENGYPIEPPKPATPSWLSPAGLVRYLLSEKLIPPIIRHLRRRRLYSRAWRLFLHSVRWFEQQQAKRRQQEAAALREKRQREQEEALARAEWRELHRAEEFDRIEGMSGVEFEELLQRMFTNLGYQVQTTKGSGDQGADLVLTEGDCRIAVQAKRYKGSVGNAAIQEVLGGLLYYHCGRGMVVTTGVFTKSAYDLAHRASNIELWDGTRLRREHARAFPVEPPEFTWEALRSRRKPYTPR